MNIDSLELQVKSSSTNATKSIDRLLASLEKLDAAVGKMKGLEALNKQFKTLDDNASSNMKSLHATLEKFEAKISELTAKLQPLVGAMDKVSASAHNMDETFKSVNKYKASVQEATKDTKALTKSVNFAGVFLAFKSLASKIAGLITQANAYVEDMNLFTVSMGNFADEARRYVEQVSEVMGIDPAVWMRNQGIFMTLETGFGVASDRAYIMSKNLTQLAYDLSSFFNISVEDSMQRLQSGISGELEPLTLAA